MGSQASSKLGKFTLGNSRLGVYTSKWEQQILKLSKSVTWRVCNLHTTRDSTTGHRNPSYSTTHTINMILVDRGGSIPSFASGVTIRQDAVGICMDGVSLLDEVKEINREKYYKVYAPPEVHYDPDSDGFAFRVLHLERSDLRKEG